MDWLTRAWPLEQIEYWDYVVNGGLFLLSLVYFGFELLRYAYLKKMSWTLIGDSVANFITFYVFPFVSYLLGAAVVIAAYDWIYEHWSVARLPVTPWSIFVCILLCDFVYYWEHRFMHRTGVGWMTHTVHHSSPLFNISVAYRFGPLDGVYPLFFHLPLAAFGFHPLLIFASEIFVQQYQALLHTEFIGRLPRWVEAVFNTPSHHRVHHGSNKQYHDKNYGGVLIVWDRLFGTFEPEREAVRYGITKPIDSVNPVVVFLHGLTRFWRTLRSSKSLGECLSYFVRPPGWRPRGRGAFDDAA